MPIYIYTCDHCGSEATISHSMTEIVEDCEVCEESGSLARRPSIFSSAIKTSEQKAKVGNYVKGFIEEAKQDLKQQKTNLGEKNDS
jgi:putative FmdB family regulatory protein